MTANQTVGLNYWERLASRYDASVGLLSGPLPPMLERVGRAAAGAEDVLEVAAGTGLVTTTLASNARRVLATDYSAAMVEQLKRRVASQQLTNVTVEVANVYDLPYATGRFDLVLAANVLHLVPDLPAALAALLAVLRDGGTLLVPTYSHDQTLTSKMVSRVIGLTGFPGQRRFTTYSLSAALTEAGLEVAVAETLPGLIPISYVEAKKGGRR